MAIDTTPGTPGAKMKSLAEQLAARRSKYQILDDYLCGRNVPPQRALATVKESYYRLMKISCINFAELIVEAVRERMQVTGFRTGADDDENGDKLAWQMWTANSLDADASLVDRAFLGLGDAYMIIGGVDRDTTFPVITPEDPRQVITEADPIRRRKTIAALKMYADPTAGLERAVLYLPGVVYKASRPLTKAGSARLQTWSNDWKQDSKDDMPHDRVPVVRFANRYDLTCNEASDGRAMGEIEPHIGLLDRINYQALNALEIATLQAFRQRAVKGVPTHDSEGNEIDYSDIFNMDPSAIWQIPDTAEIWESGQVDMGPVREAIKSDSQILAAVSRTPLFYISPDAANGSAEGASLMREGLVFKTEDRLANANESYEEVMSIGFTVLGDQERASRQDMEILRAPAERFTLSERYDAAVKAKAAGVPWETIMRDVLQMSPQQVARMDAERTADAALLAAFSPDPTIEAAAVRARGSGEI